MKTKVMIHEGSLADFRILEKFIPLDPVTVTGAGGKRFGFRESEGVFIVNVGETRHVFDIKPQQRQLIENYLFRKMGDGWKTVAR